MPGTPAVMCTRTANPIPITSTPATREEMTSYLLTVRPSSLIGLGVADRDGSGPGRGQQSEADHVTAPWWSKVTTRLTTKRK